MRAEFDQDDLDPGYAHVRLTKEQSDAVFYEDGDSIAVGRAVGSDEYEYLRHDGGVGGGVPEALALERKPEVEGDSVVFILQPAYVDSMEPGSYTVCFVGKDGKPKGDGGRMEAYDVSWSESEGTRTLRDYRAEEARQQGAETDARRKAAEEARRKEAEVIEARRQEAEARRKAEEQARQQAEAEAGKEAEKSAAGPVGASVVVPVAMEDQAVAPAQAEKKSGKGPLLGGIALVAVLAAGGISFLTLNDKPTVDAEKVQEDTARAEAAQKAAEAEAAKKAAEEAARAEAEKKAAEEAAKAMRADAKGRVAAFFSGSRTPDAAMRLAGELDAETAEQQDAVFRLYYYAAGQDHPQGALRYAECLDPSMPAWGTVQKDGAEAWQYYGQSPEGESARSKLKAWAQQAAQQGDAAAAQWLKEMK